MSNHDAVTPLSSNLQPIYETVRDLLAGSARDEVRSRHRVGVLIAQVKRAPGTYGTHAVEELARRLNASVPTLYRHSMVAECWSEPALGDLMNRTTPHGQPLSWSHLVLLAGVTSANRRTVLLERALEEGLSVRALSALLDGPNHVDGAEAGGARVLDRLARTAQRWSQRATEMHHELLAHLERTSSVAPHPDELVDRAIAAQEELHGIIRKNLASLKAERDRIRAQDGRPEPRSRLLLAGSRLA
jgi:hypothetical protein